MEQERLITLYTQHFGAAPSSIQQLPGAGSNRRYYRITSSDGSSYIGCIGTSAEENRSFIALARHLYSQGLSVPQVFCASDDCNVYIQQDLGSVSLFDYIKEGREAGGNYSEAEQAVLRQVMSDLPDLQFRGGSPDIFKHCYPQAEMDSTSVMFDLNYFKYCFLKLSGLEFNEYTLQADFQQLCADLLSEDADTFLYRDFQARNVMLLDGKPYYIDFQGGRRGPIYYDVASFLWQASARYGDQLRSQLIDVYWHNLQRYITAADAPACYRGMTKECFLQRLHLYVFFRILQVLGAYGYRGLWEKKRHFIESIAPALDNLRTELQRGSASPYPYLQSVLQQLTENTPKQLKDKMATLQPHKQLIVRVFSFSFKKGIPEDASGNGGGYVFDCRSTNNPGRYAEYKTITGLDQPVIDFLEKDGEILQFLSHIYPIVDFHTQRWLDRGFSDLQISFGCTGGQHRSVYSAQHVAEHLHEKFGVEVHLCHREQGITQIFK